MARPIKDGVDYFPKDTDFYTDDKVRLLRAEFGAKGMYILDYLMCEIYGKNGYFIKWDKNRCFLVSDGAGCGCSPEYISEFISGCLRCSFFDERVFQMFGVLTSAGIQRRYIRMFGSRESIVIKQEYWLLDVNDRKDVPARVLAKLVLKSDKTTGNPDKNTGNPDKNTGNPQKESKVKETKVSQKEKKRKETAVSFIPEALKDAFAGFAEMRKQIKAPLTDKAVKLTLSELERLAPGDIEMQKAILNQSTMRSWRGVFALKEGNKNGKAVGASESDTSPVVL